MHLQSSTTAISPPVFLWFRQKHTAFSNHYKMHFKLQKRAIRIVCKVKYNAHTDPLFNKLNMWKLQDIFNVNCLKIYHKYINGKLPNFFENFCVFNSHRYNTRNQYLTNVRTRTKCAAKRLRCYIVKCYNSTPDIVREKLYTHSIKGFADYMRRYVTAAYPLVCSIPRCYICNR